MPDKLPRIIVDSVRPKRTPLRMLQGVLIGTLAGLAVWFAWKPMLGDRTSALTQAQTALEKARSERQTLERELSLANNRIDELQEARVYAEQSLAIDQQAHADLQASIARLQAEAADLREQIEFYRGIVSPEQVHAGVRIYDMSVSPTEIADTYRYEMMLIQAAHKKKRVNGRIEVTLTARDDAGRERVLDWSELGIGHDTENLLFSLRYFQDFSGEFRLPPGLIPLRLRIRLMEDKSDVVAAEATYEWQAILGEGDNG